MPEIYSQIIPKIYAYTTKEHKPKGWIKVGQTIRKSVDIRIKEQTQTSSPEADTVEILYETEAITNNGKTFSDHQIHKKLEEKGYKRLQGEWFECNVTSLENVILEIKTGRELENTRTNNFGTRPEQQEAIELTKNYFTANTKSKDGKAPHFLWNAKMRFGKTFTSYKLALEIGWTKIMILTYKPVVASAWKEDLQNHIDFEGWQFIGKDDRYEEIDNTKPFVWFASFQDIMGRDRTGSIKERLEAAHLIDWDCVILDEYHFGSWQNSAKDLYDGETAKESGLEFEKYEVDEESLPLKVNNFLYLSGTPFRAIATGEFLEDQIYNWTYADEQRAKQNWDKSKGSNPYEILPQIQLLTYELPDKIREIAMKGENDGFSLNEFFRAELKNGIYNFIHTKEVQMWLNMIRGNELISKNIPGQENSTPPLPYQDIRLVGSLNHTFWFLPSVASCNAMGELLKQRQNVFYQGYEIIVCAGTQAGIGEAAFQNVKNKIGTGFKTKTITLSCGKLTTGVSVPQWNGIFFLRDTTSPETYFQAGFRVQTPWYINGVEGKSKDILKSTCFIFDFSPNRALNLINDYNSRLDLKEGKSPEKKVTEFLNFLPVLCYDGSSMKELNAQELLDIAITGVASSMLAKRWQSAQMVNVGDFVLEKLLNNPQLMEALEKIEAFRNLSKDINKVITSEKSIKKLKRDNEILDDKELPEKEKAEKKENQGIKKQLREKLLKFITRVPVFMYLTDHREENLRDVITQIEPELFTKVTGISIIDFEKMCEIGVFNSQNLNSAIFAFRRYEEASLVYIGGKTISDHDQVGGWDTEVERYEIPLIIDAIL